MLRRKTKHHQLINAAVIGGVCLMVADIIVAFMFSLAHHASKSTHSNNNYLVFVRPCCDTRGFNSLRSSFCKPFFAYLTNSPIPVTGRKQGGMGLPVTGEV